MTRPGNDLERDLQRALRRKQPSADFTSRVLARLPEEKPSRWHSWFGAPVLRWATAAVVVVAVGSGGYAYRQHKQEEERGRLARQQVMLALRITGAKLQLAQQRVHRIGADQSAAPPQETEKEQ